MKTSIDYLEDLKANKVSLFYYMKEKFPVFTNSNIFLRDIEYGIKGYYEKKDIKMSFRNMSLVAAEFVEFLESSGDLTPICRNTWRLDFMLDETHTGTEEASK